MLVACLSLARVSRAPYIFHAPATQAGRNTAQKWRQVRRSENYLKEMSEKGKKSAAEISETEITFLDTYVGFYTLCQHYFEHNSEAKALSIMPE